MTARISESVTFSNLLAAPFTSLTALVAGRVTLLTANVSRGCSLLLGEDGMLDGECLHATLCHVQADAERAHVLPSHATSRE